MRSRRRHDRCGPVDYSCSPPRITISTGSAAGRGSTKTPTRKRRRTATGSTSSACRTSPGCSRTTASKLSSGIPEGIGFQGIDYSAYLLAGLLPWLAFQEAMNKGVAVIVANATIVKQVVFPVEVLPIKVVLAAFVPQMIGTVILLVYVLITSGSL